MTIEVPDALKFCLLCHLSYRKHAVLLLKSHGVWQIQQILKKKFDLSKKFTHTQMTVTIVLYFAMKGTCMASLYSSVAIFVASAMFLQSISQNLADTVVVKFTQSLTNVKGVEPVTSSHWALVVPPKIESSNMNTFV